MQAKGFKQSLEKVKKDALAKDAVAIWENKLVIILR